MNEFPKVTVIPNEEGDPRVFFGETELPFEIWDVKAKFGLGTPTVSIEIPASAVEFRTVA